MYNLNIDNGNLNNVDRISTFNRGMAEFLR